MSDSRETHPGASVTLSACRSSFKDRALLYWKLDGQLSRQTRFFGAAALTNTALYELSSPLGRWVVGLGVQRFLCGLGAHLQNINQRSAQLISARTCMAPTVDVAMVTLEQQAVQGELNSLGARDFALLRRVTTDVDFLLNSEWIHLMRMSGAAVHTYVEILRRVRRELGGRIYFAHQKHREAIGLGVIRSLYGLLPVSPTSDKH
jgi:hypothetical protein